MSYEEIKASFLEILKEINMEELYADSVTNAEIVIKISENENLYNSEITTLAFIYALVFNIDMEILIDKKKLKKMLGTPAYDNSIRSMLFYYNKPDYKDFLNENEQTVLSIYKDIEKYNKIFELNKNIQVSNTDTISEEISNNINELKSADETKATNSTEKAVCILSDIFNIKYKYVVYMIEENNLIDNIIKQININEINKPSINKIYASIKKYAMERL